MKHFKNGLLRRWHTDTKQLTLKVKLYKETDSLVRIPKLYDTAELYSAVLQTYIIKEKYDVRFNLSKLENQSKKQKQQKINNL